MVQVDFINVGYGDSVLIRFAPDTPQAFCVLVDCGEPEVRKNSPQSCRISCADFLKEQAVPVIDLLIVTHLHLDHVGGLLRTAETVRVKELWTNYLPLRENWGRPVSVSPAFGPGVQNLQRAMDVFSKALKVLSEKGCRIRCITQAETLAIPGTNDYIDVIAADPRIIELQKQIWDGLFSGKSSESDLHRLDMFINNTSLRTAVRAEEKVILLPGDIYADEWQRHEVPHCDILKIPHHGHKDAMNEKLLKMASPENTVISVSDDRPDDCPAKGMIGLISHFCPRIFFTDAVRLPGKEPRYHASVHFLLRDDRLISDDNN